MDLLHQNIIAMAASWTEEEAARHIEHMACIAAYLRAFGVGIQVSVPTSEPAMILIAAAQVLDSCKELSAPSLVRSLAVSEARRNMAVLDAKTQADAQARHLFTRSHWAFFYMLAQGALTVVRKDESRRAIMKVIKLAARKANSPRRLRSKKPPTLVIVGETKAD